MPSPSLTICLMLSVERTSTAMRMSLGLTPISLRKFSVSSRVPLPASRLMKVSWVICRVGKPVAR